MSEKFDDDHKIETYKSMITISVEAFKLLALLNGGAAAGMIAALDKVQKFLPVCAIRLSMCCFVVGLIAIAWAFVLSYTTQNVLFQELMDREKKDTHISHIKSTYGFVVASILFFTAGALIAAFNIQQVAP